MFAMVDELITLLVLLSAWSLHNTFILIGYIIFGLLGFSLLCLHSILEP